MVTSLAALTVPRTWLPNESDDGETDRADLTPVPVNATCLVPAPPAAVTVKKAFLDPVLVGLNFTEIAQVLPPGTVGGQLWLWEN
jgi:hypothetical protein